MDARQKQAMLWYALAALGLVFLIQWCFTVPAATTIAYSDFKALLAAGKIEDVTVGTDTIEASVDLTGAQSLLSASTVQAIKQQGLGATAPVAGPAGKPTLYRVIARRVEDPGLTAELDAAKVSYAAANENRWLATVLSWVLPALIFVLIWSFVLRRSVGGAGCRRGGVAVRAAIMDAAGARGRGGPIPRPGGRLF